MNKQLHLICLVFVFILFFISNANTQITFSNIAGNSNYACDENPEFSNPTASTTCGDPTVSISFNDSVTGSNCAGDIITRTWTATDNCGNSATESETLTPDDNENPEFSGIGGLEYYDCSGNPVFSNPTGMDNCSSTTIDYSDTVTSTECGGDVITREWVITDQCGNSTVEYEQAFPEDFEAPEINGVGSDGTYNCGNNPVFSNPTATDNCSSATLTYTDSYTSYFCADIVIRTWTATDDCGNESFESQTMTPFDPNDTDYDGVANASDNCPDDYNPGQEDIDDDGLGDVCDTSNTVEAIVNSEDHIYVDKPYSGIILQSPDGSCWIIVVHNDGSLKTLSTVCP